MGPNPNHRLPPPEGRVQGGHHGRPAAQHQADALPVRGGVRLLPRVRQPALLAPRPAARTDRPAPRTHPPAALARAPGRRP